MIGAVVGSPARWRLLCGRAGVRWPPMSAAQIRLYQQQSRAAPSLFSSWRSGSDRQNAATTSVRVLTSEHSDSVRGAVLGDADGLATLLPGAEFAGEEDEGVFDGKDV